MLSFFLVDQKAQGNSIEKNKEPAFGVVLYRLTSYACIHCVSLRCPDVNRRKKTLNLDILI